MAVSVRRPVGWLVALTLAALAHVGSSRPATLEVAQDGSAPFTSIQDAIDAASPGVDDVFVHCGTYLETLVLKSGVDVRGERAFCTFVDALGSGSVVTVRNLPDAGELSGLTLRGGRADYGGGILVENASPVITRNVIMGNEADWFGGGMAVRGGLDPSGTAPHIRYNLFLGNFGPSAPYYGAGLDVYDAVGVRVEGNLFVEQAGTAIALADTDAEVTHNTLARNAGHGVYVATYRPVVLSGNAVAWNDGAGVAVVPGSDLSSRNNDVYGHAPNWEGVPDPTGSDGNLSEDPLFVDERSSSFKGFQPRTDSPLVDVAAAAEAPAEDLRGIPRPVDGGHGPRTDIGARENEGLSRLRFSGKNYLEWDVGEYFPNDHNVYRGDLAVLRETGDYTQNTAEVPHARRFVECGFWLRDDLVPDPGQCLFYLAVTYSPSEGTLGFDSDARERTRTGSPDWQYCGE